MKTTIRGRFQKQKLSVGLSNLVPFAYSGPEEKYAKADLLSPPNAAHHPLWRTTATTTITYESTTLDVELIASDALGPPQLLRCIQLVSALPETALPEAEEELVAIRDHYHALHTAEREPPRLTTSHPVKATVIEQVKT